MPDRSSTDHSGRYLATTKEKSGSDKPPPGFVDIVTGFISQVAHVRVESKLARRVIHDAHAVGTSS